MSKILKKRAASWTNSRGKSTYLRYLDGERLTQREAILAKCAECCGGYQDGRLDCRMPACPLYPFMPYREDRAEGPSLPVDGVAGARGATEPPGDGVE